MKRLLSIILAIAMCITLLPALASATGETTDGTISYKISSDCVKTTAFTGTHNIPVSENGKLSLKASSSATETTEYETTVFNVLANLKGTHITYDKTLNGSELGFVSYRNLIYHMYGDKNQQTTWNPVKMPNFSITKFVQNDTAGKVYDGDSIKEFSIPATLDTDKTAPYELWGKTYNDSHLFLKSAGLYQTLQLQKTVTSTSEVKLTDYLSETVHVRRPSHGLRIKLDKAGKYRLSVYNNFTSASNSDGIEYAAEAGNSPYYYTNVKSEMDVYVIPIDKETGFEWETAETGGHVSYALVDDDKNGSFDVTYKTTGTVDKVPDRNNAYLDWEATTKLTGTYSSYPGARKNFDNVLELTEGEYIIYFEINPDSVRIGENTYKVSSGTTTTTAIEYQYFALSGIDLIPVPEDEQFTNEFDYETDNTPAFTAPVEGETAKTTANFYSAVVGETIDTSDDKLLGSVKPVLGTEYSYTAPDKTSEGLTFRYWAKALTANKQIVTRDATVKFMPTTEVMNLVAVYEPTDTTVAVSGDSFYNANGQLLTDVAIIDGKMPALPSMAGYGTASAWVQYGTGKEFSEGETAPSENRMFVAKYADPTVAFKVDVVNGTGDGNYAYGDTVICVAETPETGKVFKCWTKTGSDNNTRIVSTSTIYKFKAWEPCTVEAVYADEEPYFTGKKISIILGSIGNVDLKPAYMAEFVGLTDAVEKGIIFGTKRVAMTSADSQFTAVDDLGTSAGDIKGYAILTDGTVIYDK